MMMMHISLSSITMDKIMDMGNNMVQYVVVQQVDQMQHYDR